MTTLEELLSPNEALKCAKAGVDIKQDVANMSLLELWNFSNLIVELDYQVPTAKVEIGLRVLLERSAKKRVSLFIR